MSQVITRTRTRLLAGTLAGALAGTAVAVGIAALPAEAASTTCQAESAALSGGAVVASDHTGYTGTGFVAGYTDANKGNAATSFTVSATAAGSDTLTLRYANGTGSPMSVSLYVNGVKARQVSLPATTDWNTWGTETKSVRLNAGNNAIGYRFDGTDLGNVNLDSVTVTAASQYEAESATLSGGAVVASDHTGYTGTGFVGGYTDANKGNAATTFTVSAAAAGPAPVTLRYANGTGAAMSLSLYANGVKLRQVSLPTTADWNTWGTETESVILSAGSNTIAYRFDGTDLGNVNLDNITVASAAGSPSPSPSASRLRRPRRRVPAGRAARPTRRRPGSSPAVRASRTRPRATPVADT